MKPILLNIDIPKNVTLIVRKSNAYRSEYTIYIKGHWFRSWYGYNVTGYSAEEAVSAFAESYYGHIVTTNTSKYPEEFL